MIDQPNNTHTQPRWRLLLRAVSRLGLALLLLAADVIDEVVGNELQAWFQNRPHASHWLYGAIAIWLVISLIDSLTDKK